MDSTAAARLVEGLFPDKGASLLQEAGLSGEWSEALSTLPGAALDLRGVPADRAGEVLLERVREHWSVTQKAKPAFAVTRALIRRRTVALGELHPDTLMEVGVLGALADRAGKQAEASQLLTRAYEGMKQAVGVDDLRVAVLAGHLAMHAFRSRDPVKGELMLHEAYLIRKRVAPESTGQLAAQLAELLCRQSKNAEAVPFLKEAWERYRDEHGPADARTVARARTLALILTQLDRETEAIPVLRVVMEDAARQGDQERRFTIAFQLGQALETVGHREEAYRLIEEGLRWTRENGDPHPELASRLTTWARMQTKRGRPFEAEGLLTEALDAERRARGDSAPEVGVRYLNLGNHLCLLNRLDEATGWFEAATSILRGTWGDQHWQTKQAVDAYCNMLCVKAERAIQERDHRYVRELLQRARELSKPVLGPRHGTTLRIEKYGF